MKELVFQKQIIDAAKQGGGYGLKLSHKFKVGIPDLMVLMPGEPAAFFERRNRSGDPADRQSHALLACASNARKYAQAHAAAARIRRAFGTASAGLLFQPRPSR